jgi:RNA polymerase sigma-70 factor (ECF subfamily)
MPTERSTTELIGQCDSRIDELFAECLANAPNFGITPEAFGGSLKKSLVRFLESSPETSVTAAELTEFIDQIQAGDLFLALACANGNERAWWEFDQQHRAFLERVARHLAKTEIDAQEVIDSVYVELYGTRVVDGARVSKFATYSGRGSLRGWLRTVIWHSLVDLHRASHDEVSLDEMTENVGEGAAHAAFAVTASGGEGEMLDDITRRRYQTATVESLDRAFSSLEDHEKLLLLYYHVEQLKLREIARLVENEGSPLREWFQRKLQRREQNPRGRIHESTVMRWLDKSYAKVLQSFRNDLQSGHGFTADEVRICTELASHELAPVSLFRSLGGGGVSGE